MGKKIKEFFICNCERIMEICSFLFFIFLVAGFCCCIFGAPNIWPIICFSSSVASFILLMVNVVIFTRID